MGKASNIFNRLFGPSGLRPLLDFYLYSSIHISLGATALTYATYLLIGHPVDETYLQFIFGSTLLLYSLHRLIGMAQVRAFDYQGRFAVIRRYRSHIILYALLGAGVALHAFVDLPRFEQYLLILPALIALAYVLPVFPRRRRLRDYNHLKIFLIALNWAVVTAILPAIQAGATPLAVMCFGLERALFIFAITLPFDIRDMEIDKHAAVQTIPQRLGGQKTIRIATICLGVAIATFLFLWFQGIVRPYDMLAIFITYMTTIWLVRQSSVTKTDDHYSGWLDGTMLLFCLLIVISRALLS